ncbi:MAG: FtsW/RodA/SpoVE family cell cycle protein, partial [Acidobacteria bacterium]|nr:FtsW/RodA/SpoVE family cell cycle protein [Acidobacteriota bacterium]
MRMTYSTAADRARAASTGARRGGRRTEFVALVAASAVSLAGLLLVCQAHAPQVAEIAAGLADRRVANLNEVSRADDLLPALEPVILDASERRFVAERIAAYVSAAEENAGARRRVESVGSLATLSVSEGEIGPNRRLPSIRARLAERKAEAGPASAGAAPQKAVSVPLLTGAELADLKPRLVVRRPGEFQQALAWSIILFLAGFYLAHAVARWRRSTADPCLLPAIHLLCGIGLMTMVSLRDPLRDLALYARFAQGTAAGCVLLVAAGFIDFQRSVLRRLSYVPLAGAMLLSLLLIVFGSGPGTSDARVNLLGVQPVEAIRLLVVFFLAGYFASRWEFLRELTEPHLERSRVFVNVPRFDYVLPVLVGMALLLIFFFLQKDLGPALTLACVFLALYGVARRRLTMVSAGLLLLVAGFVTGYWLGVPVTVVQRVEMWRSPWDTAFRGGSQIAHALWALASGGWAGAGPGLGDPRFVPASHTDLVLAAIGEELGLPGLIAVFVLSGVLAFRSLRIALRAPGDYTFFLALGLTLSVVFQLLLISAGLLGLLPLTGVATPFLSYGRSSMIANFAAVGILLSTSERSPGRPDRPEFEQPVAWLFRLVAVLLAVIAMRAAYVQVIAADRIAGAPALTVQADGGRRFEYNPRLLAVARQIVRGTISDRNGIPLATSRPADLASHAEDLSRLGIVPAEVCPRPDERCYPFGGVMFHLLGD